MTSVAAASATSLSVGGRGQYQFDSVQFRLTSTVFAANHRWMRNFIVIAVGLVNDFVDGCGYFLPQFPRTIEPIIAPA